MKYIRSFILAIAAGIAIGFGGMLNLISLSLGLKILGGFLFSVGLFTICLFGLKLFTGQVGYFFAKENKKEFLIHLFVFYFGNFLGAVGFGYLMRLLNINNLEFLKVVEEVAYHKLVILMNQDVGQPFYNIIVSSIMCGLLVFFAVDIFAKEKVHPILRLVGLVVFVATFVISGFEHCIADMFYLSFANAFGNGFIFETLLSIVCASSGNIIGAFAGYFLLKLAQIKS